MTIASVLLVDDEPEFASLLGERLTVRGFDVTLAADGEAAMAFLEGHDVDAVLLDIGLPGKSGLEVLRDIKALRPFTQVVMLTGQSSLSTAVTGMKYGAMDYLLKPADVSLIEDSLRQAKAKKLSAEESLRMMDTEKMASLGVLAEGVAHEINNPVNIIVQEAGWIGDLLEDEAQVSSLEDIRASLSNISAQGARCREITHKLLGFCGRSDPRPKDVDLGALVCGLPQTFAARAQAQGARIEVIVPDVPVMLRAAPAALSQALGNLIDNALEAMEKFPGTVSVAVRRLDQEAEVTVSDQGGGIDPAILPRIFEPFFSTKEVGKGSGLGLSIVYSIARDLGGLVSAKNLPGRGAALTLRLPLAPEPA